MNKKIIILGIIFLTAIWFWLAVKNWIANDIKFALLAIWINPLIGLVVLSSLICLAFILLKERWLKNSVFIAAGLPAVVIFGFGPFFLAALGLTFLFHLLAIRNVRQEIEERTKINIKVLAGRALPFIIAPLLMVVSFAFYLSPAVQQSVKTKQLPPTVQQVVEKTISNFVGSEVNKFPPQEREQAKRRVVSQALDRLTVFTKPYLKFFPPALAFGLYLVLQGLSFIFVWLAILISLIIFEILKKSGIIRIRLVQKEAEELEF